MSGERIELVLPLKPSNEERGSDWRRAMNGLISSLGAFCDPDFVRCLSIIVPRSGQRAAEELAQASRVPAAVVIEDDLLPIEKLQGLPRSGWYIQQMLKMHYAKICQTTYYLTLDADIVLTRKLDDSIIVNGRVPMKFEPASAHPGWWRTSANLLRAVTPVSPDDDRVFGVTPGFIRSAIMRRTLDRLDFVAADHSQDWVSYLAQHTNNSDETWTEYSLYWSVLTNIDRPDDLYYPYNLYGFYHSINQIDVKSLGKDGSTPLFAVVQSSHIDERDHADLCQRLLQQRDISGSSLAATGKGACGGPFRIEPDLARFGRKVYSQNDEDGILEELARALQIEKGSFVEFGVGPPFQGSQEQNGLEANCRLLYEKGWRGLWMDGSPSTPLVKAEFITVLNINRLLAKHGFDFDVDVFSIDVDGQDFWIWMNLAIRPKIVVIEYNCDFEPEESKVVPFNLDFRWDCTRHMGASLRAICKLASSKGYTPVHANGINVFAVRDDLILNKAEFAGVPERPKVSLHRPDPHNRAWTEV